MKTIKRHISELIINPINPREITEKKFNQLIESILVFPAMLKLREIVEDNKVILGGNMRCRALTVILDLPIEKIREIVAGSRKFTGRTEAEVDIIVEFWSEWKKDPIVETKDGSDLTEDEKKEFIIKDNVGYGEWDWDELADKWDEEDLNDWGLDVWQDDGEDEEKEDKDLSDKVGSAFEVVISCESEREQEKLYEELKERGLKCRVLTL